MAKNMATPRDCNVYVGAETGLLKGVNINTQKTIWKNYHNVKSLSQKQEICAMAWADEEEVDILLGLREQKVQVYDTDMKAFKSCLDVKGGEGPIRGLCKYDGSVLTAVESGLVKLWRYKTEDEVEINALNSGENLARMRQNPAKPHLIATGGRENDLQIWDLQRPEKYIFRAKNVKPDFLQLRVPVWVTDMAFLSHSEKVAVCTRHSHLRLYDPATPGNRPVLNVECGEQPLTAMALTPNENQVIVGTSVGCMSLYDLRKGALVRGYKGFVGGIREITCHKSLPYVASVGLDRYLRIHDINTRQLLFKVYLKSRLNCVLMTSDFKIEESNFVPSAEDTVKSPIVTSEDVGDVLWDKMEVIEESGEVHRKKRKII